MNLGALALAVSLLAFVLALAVAVRFVKLWRGLRRMHTRFVFLEQTRGDARREINRTALRVAALEHAAGIAPPNEYRDLRKVRPVDFEADELADQLAEADELGHLRKLGEDLGELERQRCRETIRVVTSTPRTPRLGDKVEVDDAGELFAGVVRGVDHVKRIACVMPPGGDWPEVKQFAWERLRFVA